MKKYIVVFVFLIVFFNARAQDPVELNITYNFSYIRDLKDKTDPYKSEMVLSIAKSGSRYTTEYLFKRNSVAAIKLRKAQREKSEAVIAGGGARNALGFPSLTVTNSGTISNEEIFIDKTKPIMTVSDKIGFKWYHFYAPVPQINWELSSEKKVISGYKCQKAFGQYGGRIYEAWFAPDLPYTFGPWKLAGLPGLILAANDTKNEITFECKEVSKNTDPEEIVASFTMLDRSVKVAPKEYKQISQMFATDPLTVIEGQIPGSGKNVRIRNTGNPDNNTVKKIAKYNPMELR